MWLMEMMLFQDEHGLGEKTIPQGENGARRRCHRCSKMKMGTREGMGIERTFFMEKIELRKGWAKGKGDLSGNIAIHQKSPHCVLREVLGHQ
ncbi:unnamed protein product [Sphagnum troendelagicum]|uniref:Uncharacterized protein n=1 Tax=Sphagnum troendelagicum TaxID=128251 RepID=A0ABP0TF63_9BRYO